MPKLFAYTYVTIYPHVYKLTKIKGKQYKEQYLVQKSVNGVRVYKRFSDKEKAIAHSNKIMIFFTNQNIKALEKFKYKQQLKGEK